MPLGWSNPIGKRFNPVGNTTERLVVGVFRDFHDQPLFHARSGVVLETGGGPYLAVRIGGENVATTLDAIRAVWKRFLPSDPFEYAFLDETINASYRAEMNLRDILGFFGLLSIFLSCLGVLGLMWFAVQRRTKEIGIRKVLGATTKSIVRLLSSKFAALILSANCIAVPIVYYVARSWLEGFAYRVEIGPLTVLVPLAVMLISAGATVACVGVPISRTDPVKALSCE